MTPRPGDLGEFDKRFKRRPALEWLSPRVLLDAGRVVVLSNLFALPHKEWRRSPEKESWFEQTVELTAPRLIEAPIEVLPE